MLCASGAVLISAWKAEAKIGFVHRLTHEATSNPRVNHFVSCSSGCYSLLDSSRRPPTLVPNQHTPGAFFTFPQHKKKLDLRTQHQHTSYTRFWSQCGLPLPYLLSPTTTAAPRPSINCRKRAHLRSALVSSAATVLCRRSTSICSLCSRSVWRKRARSVSTSALCLLVSRHEMKKAQGNKKKTRR